MANRDFRKNITSPCLRDGVVNPRRHSRVITLGRIKIGGDHSISIQSMCRTPVTRVDECLKEINTLATIGCEIIRIAIPHHSHVTALQEICARSPIPIVADIHFDYRLAIAAAKVGVHGLRYNPGNITNHQHIIELSKTASDYHLPIRIGVNAASLPDRLIQQYGGASPEAITECALSQASMLEEVGFTQIKISLKASDPLTTIAAYRCCASRCDYPLHLGLTEAGPPLTGAIKSGFSLGVLLMEGIGDTLRISLSASASNEVIAARQLLRSLGLRNEGAEIIACPCCSRCTVDVIGMMEKLEPHLSLIKTPIRVAIMGCEVNGPGEAASSDIGIAGANGSWVLFIKGEKVCKLSNNEVEASFMKRVQQVVIDKQGR